MPRKITLLLLLLLCAVPASAQVVQPLPPVYARSDNMGLTFIAYTNNIGQDLDVRYRQALEMGAGWHRYPIYWNVVETSPGVFNWGQFDTLVEADRSRGFQTNAILLGTPGFYGDSTSITGLNEPVFADGTDVSGFGKQINPGNKWAQYVFLAVNRYRPGGVLANQRNWGPTEGIRVWEMWNEPDLELFWRGSQADYARLLKVGYLAAHHADSAAQVMFGGLAYGNPDTNDWLNATLSIYATDPARDQNNWYMDIVGLHSYSTARRTGLVVARVKNTLANYGLDRPVWVNETGVPVWDDYPGPTFAADDPSSRRLRGTMNQQASFVMQSTAYALAAGAEKVFFHQLYDDCGDTGGDFAPDSGQAGDAFGFYRNPSNYDCFSQHPMPGTARPAVAAYTATARLLGDKTFDTRQAIRRQDGSVFVELGVAGAQERITFLWNETPGNNTITWGADTATLRATSDRGDRFSLTAAEGIYTVTLPPARLNDDPQRPPGDAVTIGGPTFALVEQLTGTVQVAAGPGAVVTPRAPLPSQVGSILGGGVGAGPSAPTADLTPPITGMEDLPSVSNATFTVTWNGADAGGIDRYLVWVAIDNGEWNPWFEGSATQAEFTGTPGRTYSFAVWAVDRAGNWSLNTDLEPQAQTFVTE